MSCVDRFDDYLRRATEADATADKLREPEMKRQYRDLAEQWRTLARQVRLYGTVDSRTD
jgi:hypothetical protein